MMKTLRFFFATLLMAVASSSFADTIVDELTADALPATNSTYTAFSGKMFSSTAVYAGNTAKNSEGDIQIRTNNSNSGIVTTGSGGKVKSITVTWGTGNAENRQLDIYGKSTPYSSAADLYATTGNTEQGDLIGSLTASGTITVEGDYEYIGLRSKTGAMYLAKINITWEGQAGTGVVTINQFPYDVNFTQTQDAFEIDNVELDGLEYVWSQDNQYGMKATAYKSGNHTTESWLVSPLFDLSNANGAPTISFSHAVNKFSDEQAVQTQTSVWVREEGGNWNKVNGVKYPETQSWTFVPVSENQIDLSSYTGKKIQIGFKYESDDNSAGTWEIGEFHFTLGELVVTYEDMTMSEATAKSLDGTGQKNINLKLNNALVVYDFVRGSDEGFFVREGDFAIEFFNTGLGLKAGQTITGSIKCNLSHYNHSPEVKKADDASATNLDNVTLGTGTVTPIEMTADEAYDGVTHLGDLVIVKEAPVISKKNENTGALLYYVQCTGHPQYDKDNNFTGYGEMRIYDYFGGFTFPEIPASYVHTFDIKAIYVANSKTTRRLWVLDMKTPGQEDEATAIQAVTTEQTDGAIYNLQGQRISQPARGLYIQNGRKYIAK